MSPLIISFFTSGTPYERDVKRLLESIERFRLRAYIQPAQNRGTWEKNCQYKANFILEAMEKFDENIVWVDADAVFNQPPVLFENLDCDLAYYYLPQRQELLSGTLFIRNTNKMKTVIQQWIDLNNTNHEWDQKNLQKIVESDPELNTCLLPPEYCKIDKHRVQRVDHPVITHYQASRRYKRIINRRLRTR